MKGQARCAVAASALAYLDTSIAAQLEENKAGCRVARLEAVARRSESQSRRIPPAARIPDFASLHPGYGLNNKKAPACAGALMQRNLRFAYLVSRFLSAVPRMSPSVAPESEEPYCAMASFSSATSSALIDTWTLRAFLSNWITRASTFSPTAKRSAR